ncbi:MAG: DUF1631 family protein [Luteimonas sp.]
MDGSIQLAQPASRQLLTEIQDMSVERLGAVVDVVLRQADDYLFDRSAQATEGTELTALRDLRRVRMQLRQVFVASITAAFHRLQQPEASQVGKRKLDLLSEEALEQQLASEQMADNLCRRHAMALEMLDQRIAVLADRSVCLAGDNPAGPPALARAMGEALAGLELSTSLRIALYKFMERELATALTALYDRINARLGDAGILPRLLPNTPSSAEGREPEAPTATSPAAASAGPAADSPADHALFSNLIGMLQSWRQHVLPPTNERRYPGAAPLGLPQLMSALSLLQSDPPVLLDQAVVDTRLSLGDLLRKEVLAGARRLGMGGDEVNLSAVQEDAVDLVGMLFDVLLDERDFAPDVRRKIGRMLVPYVKVAVKDRRMFVYKGHPARRFLNAVAEACEGNHGDVPQERELLDHVATSIDRLVAEFNEDVAIFETLEHELRSFMAQHRQRIEIAERRAAETQRGRERLDAAREQAVSDIQARIGTRELPMATRDLMVGYATHHLTQVGLRGGARTDAYQHALGIIDGVVAAFDAAVAHPPIGSQPLLDRAGLIAMLGSSGCVGSEAEEAVDVVQRSLAAWSSSRSEERPTQLPPSMVPVVAPASPPLALVAGLDTLDYEPAAAERMRELTVGTWLLYTGESGRSEPAKVSWISPISSRFLFVNRRGARILVASAEELAAMEKAGRVQLRSTGSAFDDALQQMVGRLQSKVAA